MRCWNRNLEIQVSMSSAVLRFLNPWLRLCTARYAKPFEAGCMVGCRGNVSNPIESKELMELSTCKRCSVVWDYIRESMCCKNRSESSDGVLWTGRWYQQYSHFEYKLTTTRNTFPRKGPAYIINVDASPKTFVPFPRSERSFGGQGLILLAFLTFFHLLLQVFVDTWPPHQAPGQSFYPSDSWVTMM